MVTVEDLYRHFGVLADATDKASEHEENYKAILEGVKGGVSEKRLASQFIIRFFKHFPHLTVDSINAMFDLCEDSDMMIRKQAIKDLPSLCRVTPDQVSKITEALTMLLACEDSTEQTLVHSSLVSIFKINPKEALKGLFIPLTGEETDSEVTECTLKFLSLKLKGFLDDWLDHSCEEIIVEQFKKMLRDVGKEEFILIVGIMKQLKVMSTMTGRQQLVDIVTSQAELDQPFNVTDSDNVERLIQCGKLATPLFSKNVHSKTFIVYMCDRVLPALVEVAADEGNSELELLKMLADMTEHAGELEDGEATLQGIYDKLITYMPPPPEEATDPDSSTEQPKLQFSHAECLLFTFHRLAKKYPKFLTDDAHTERLEDFKIRLRYFARGTQAYIKQLRAALQDKTGADLKTDENKIKVVALKITTNINLLVKDLLHVPPSFKASVTPSWSPITVVKPGEKIIAAGEKRTPITMTSDPSASKHPRQAQTFYAPPRDKYSSNYNTGQRGRGRGGRSRGGFRSY